MLKVIVTGMRMHARYRVTGSVLNNTVMGAGTTLEIHSPSEVARIAQNAEGGGFVMQTLPNPVPVTRRTALNGLPLAMA